MKELEDLTRRLVRIPSHRDKGEEEAGEFIREWLEERTDARIKTDEAGNVIARKKNGSEVKSGGMVDEEVDNEEVVDEEVESEGESIALVGHHDVVPPDNSQVEDGKMKIEKEDGRLYGRGTADMKGAVAAEMLAFRDASENWDETIFASFASEEQGGIGAKHAVEKGFHVDYAIVGEGSTGYSRKGVTDVAVAHKGRRELHTKSRGKSAHASEVEKGVNAIYRAADAVKKVKSLDPPKAEVYGNEMKGSIAVTEIEGGKARNVIPDSCSFTVDERTVPGETAVVEKIEGEGTEVEVVQNLPPMVCEDKEFSELVRKTAERVQKTGGGTGTEPELVTKPHATDAGRLSEGGVETVVCGPAEPGEAHTENESVSLEVLENCYEIYRQVLESR